MPRPLKERSIANKPTCCKFVPEQIYSEGSIVLSFDEFNEY
jgi:predicted DNA-binding protein (UPF0251 family)